jgi:hypothetical protein
MAISLDLTQVRRVSIGCGVTVQRCVNIDFGSSLVRQAVVRNSRSFSTISAAHPAFVVVEFSRVERISKAN